MLTTFLHFAFCLFSIQSGLHTDGFRVGLDKRKWPRGDWQGRRLGQTHRISGRGLSVTAWGVRHVFSGQAFFLKYHISPLVTLWLDACCLSTEQGFICRAQPTQQGLADEVHEPSDCLSASLQQICYLPGCASVKATGVPSNKEVCFGLETQRYGGA